MHADAVAQRGLDQRLREAAVGQVVGAGQQPDRLDEQLGQRLLGGQVDPRRPPAEVAVHDVRPLRAGQLVAGLAEQEDLVAVGRRSPIGVRRVTSSITPSTPTTGVGRIAVSPVWL